jgi:hypothetical protein
MAIYMPEEKPRELPPPGSHLAVCYMICDLGTQPGGRFPARRQILIAWELPEELRADGQPFTISRRYGYSSNSNSNLRGDVESWLGRVLTSADLGKLDLTDQLGCSCILGVKHESHEDGRVFANVTSVMAPGKGAAKRLPPTNAAMALNLDDRPFDYATFEALPDWVRKLIEGSSEYKGIVNPAPAAPANVQKRLRARLAEKDALARELDDEIPDFDAPVPDKKLPKRGTR